MKRLVLIIFAIFALVGIQAQTYLKDGDVVSISFIANDLHYYLEASGNGILTKTYPTDDCLWELGITPNGQYTLKDLSTGRYLSWKFTDPSNSQMLLVNTNNPSAFSFENKNSVQDNYMHGYLYYSEYYAPWWNTVAMYIDGEWGGSGPYFTTHNWHNYELYIEKWEQKGAGKPTGHFNPSKIEFSYVGDQEGDAETDDDPRNVQFMIEATTESYYQCVNRPEEALLRRSTGNVDGSQVKIKNIYWESTGDSKGKSSNLDVSKYVANQDEDRTLMTISESVTQSDGNYQFTITPEGKSPMGLKDKLGTLERWVDYADNVIVEFTYGDGEVRKAEMRIVRKAYRAEELPELSFSINPVTYTFSTSEETKEFDVTLTHQHGSVIYNVDNQAVLTDYDYEPVVIPLKDFANKFTNHTWEKSFTFLHQEEEKKWLTFNNSEFNTNNRIIVTAAANTDNQYSKRSDTLVITLKNVSDFHPHEASFMIPLHQRGKTGGIQFHTQAGESASQNEKEYWDSSTDQQKVHTAERTIYYLPNQEIELRLPESGFSGYMLWYDYDTNGDPYYNYALGSEYASTSWVLSPRAANGSPFSAINTPQSDATTSTEGVSHGLYAINIDKDGNSWNGTDAAIGGILDEGNPYNPMPILRGWNYDENNPQTANHTMACDVSAYTDYTITTQNGQITDITEPTLSYRQLFHLRPASEMADTLAARSERGVYLENYKYQAPAGKQILLSTEYRHSKVRSHESELCYFYKDNDGNVHRIDNRQGNMLKWYVSDERGTREYTPQENNNNPIYIAEMDYLIVRSENYTYDAPKVYTLVMPANGDHPEYLIAKFEVEYVDIERQGPTSQTIITQQRINNQYKNLTEINFDELNTHLPWEQASYGYVYHTAPLNTQFKRGADQGAFPFYGEYMLTPRVNKDWATENAHGGAGQSLYVDGTMEPGLVASITAEAKICSGQTMYCSAWLCNPAPSGWSGEGNPIFRCNIQGKNKDEQEWHDAGVYFVGELLKGTGWQQIVFPIQAASSYDETRVSIYNFATTNQGNDFMVDDITLFVSQLPIAAYQGEMACRSLENGNTTAAAVLRIDYNNITAGSDGYMYYQIYNESYEEKDDNDNIVSTGAPVNLTGEAAYYHDYDDDHSITDHEHPYGSVHIPEKGFDPEEYNRTAEEANKVAIYTSVSAFLDDLVLGGHKHGKAYIRTEQSGVIKWLLYVAHIVNNTKVEADALTQLYEPHNYVMRMAYTPEELPTAECNLTTPIHATQQTVFKLRNSNKETIKHSSEEKIQIAGDGEAEYIIEHSTGNCPNDLYFLTSTVVNHLAINGAGGNTENIAAPIYSDWLIGDPAGDVLSEQAPVKTEDMTNEEYAAALADYNARLQDAITGFKNMYGYTQDEVTSAIMYDMRRFVTDDPNSQDYNPNHQARTFEELQPNHFLSHENYEIIKHLHENGWLHLCDTTIHFYLGTRLDKNKTTISDTVRYWCFPIAETAKTTVNVEGVDTQITLKDCNEPHRVTVSIAGGDHYMNIAPITYAKKTPQQNVQIPTLKVLEGSNEITIPITQSGNTKIAGENLETRQITLRLDDQNLTYFDLETGKPYQGKPDLVAGNEYTIRLTLLDEASGSDSPNTGCRYGYVFLNLQIIPKTLVWQPTGNSFNGWGKNENWKGWVDKNDNNVIDKTDNPTTHELIAGFVPMDNTNVIVPQLENALLYPYIVPVHDHNHYELTINYEPHHCDSIYFAPGAKIHNQHLLDYEKAFVDMQITAGSWHMMSAPLKGMVSGDMFIPHEGWWTSDENNRINEPDPFVVSGFQGIRHADAAYAFWEGFYNTTVSTVTANGAVDHTASAEFIKSNTLAQALTPGSGYQLYGLGWKDKEDLTIRLPKPDEQYSYYVDGAVSGTPEPVSIPNFEVRGKLAYDSDHDVENDPMVITLTNDVASPYFLFGNPTMAYIDMHALFVDPDNSTSTWTGNFQGMANSAWRSATQLTMIEDRYLPPMTSVLLESTGTNSMTIKLKPSHLTLNNMVNPTEQADEDNTGTQSITARRIAAYESERPENEDAQATEMLTIYAITKNAHARTVVATNPIANDYYLVGEDALFISTGVENISEVKSPLNMYTVAEQVPMMADVRQGISSIPVAILAADNARQEYMQLAFYFTSNWSRTCYFVDHKTGQKVRIMNGLIISIEMPENHEQRYSIEGPDTYQGSDGVTTSTTQPNVSTTGNKVWAYAPDRSTVIASSSDIIESARLYDLTGRLITTTQVELLSNSITLQNNGTAGVYIVDVTLRNGTTARTQVIVQ